MTETRITTKDGKVFVGNIQEFHPERNLISLWLGEDGIVTLSFSEIQSAITIATRISLNKKIGNVDEIERAREDLANGRKYNWTCYPKGKFDWE